mgnify:CR=1 FL=1
MRVYTDRATEQRMMQTPPAPRAVPPMRRGSAAKRKRDAGSALGVVRKDDKRTTDSGAKECRRDNAPESTAKSSLERKEEDNSIHTATDDKK